MLDYQKKESICLPQEHLRGIFNLAGIVMPSILLKEVKDKIIEILFAWYDAQQNAVMNEPTELDAVIMNGGESH